jgi:hypothetical protein
VRERPISAALFSGGLSGAVGDAAAQWLETPPGTAFTLDRRRYAGVVSYSCCVSAFGYLPFYTYAISQVWQRIGMCFVRCSLSVLLFFRSLLDRRIGAGASLRIVASKILADDFCFAPCVDIPAYFAWTAIVEGDSTVERLQVRL